MQLFGIMTAEQTLPQFIPGHPMDYFPRPKMHQSGVTNGIDGPNYSKQGTGLGKNYNALGVNPDYGQMTCWPSYMYIGPAGNILDNHKPLLNCL